MEIPALHTDLKVTDVPLERLAGNRHLSEEQKVAEASRQFEAILLRQILANTQKTVIPSEFSDNSTAAGIYRDMITAQLADDISKSGTFGLAKTLEHQLQRQVGAAASAGHGRSPEAPPTARAGADAVRLHFSPAEPGSHPLNSEPSTKGPAVVAHERRSAKSY